MASMVGDIWKSAWRSMEQQIAQTRAQADMLRKQMAKQVGDLSKEAMVEQARKEKDNTLQKDDELEM